MPGFKTHTAVGLLVGILLLAISEVDILTFIISIPIILFMSVAADVDHFASKVRKIVWKVCLVLIMILISLHRFKPNINL